MGAAPAPATISAGEDVPVGVVAMIPVSVLRAGTMESNDADRPECRPMSLISYLEAENMKLRQAMTELLLEIRALREALKT